MLSVQNHQGGRSVDSRLLRRIARTLLTELLQIKSFELAIYVVAAPEMTRLNETFLRHKGSTDVLTFDYLEPPRPGTIQGEIFICTEEAVLQAARFRTNWQSELVRYVIHGTLHLVGYDDHQSARRRQMKRQENLLLGKLAARFDLTRLRGTAAKQNQAGAISR